MSDIQLRCSNDVPQSFSDTHQTYYTESLTKLSKHVCISYREILPCYEALDVFPNICSLCFHIGIHSGEVLHVVFTDLVEKHSMALLSQIDLSHCDLGPSSVPLLIQMCKTFPLQRLFLCANSFGNDVSDLCSVIAEETKISSLDLSSNCIDDKRGWIAICDMIEQSKSLVALSVRRNLVVDKDRLQMRIRFANAIAKTNRITHLEFTGCFDIRWAKVEEEEEEQFILQNCLSVVKTDIYHTAIEVIAEQRNRGIFTLLTISEKMKDYLPALFGLELPFYVYLEIFDSICYLLQENHYYQERVCAATLEAVQNYKRFEKVAILEDLQRMYLFGINKNRV